MFFPVDSLIPDVVCVLQYQRTHLHMVRACPKAQFKNTGFDDGSIKVLKVKIEVDILENGMECIENTNSPRPTRRYRI